MEKPTASFEVRPTLKMILLYLWAWAIKGTIEHKNVSVEVKEDLPPN